MKQLFLPIIIIIAATSLAVVATYADFTDVEVSQGNYIDTGSFDLQLGDAKPFPGGQWPLYPDEDYSADPLGDSVEASWDYELGYPGGMEPGQDLESMVKLRNVGDIEATGLDIICHNLNMAPPPWDPDGTGPLDKDTKMIITELIYYINSSPIDLLDPSTPAAWRIENVDGYPNITLNDWEEDPIIGLPPPPIGHEASLFMVVLFDGDAGDEYQGCSTMMTLNFDLY